MIVLAIFIVVIDESELKKENVRFNERLTFIAVRHVNEGRSL